jgi:hypothetical protein
MKNIQNTKLKSNLPKLLLIVLFFSFWASTILPAQSIGDYGTVNNGNWSQTNRWRIWDGNGWNTNASSSPSGNDRVFINHNISIRHDVTIKSITITNGNLTISHASGPHTIEVTENLLIKTGASFDMSGLNSNRTNTLTIGGNITVENGAIFDMQNGNNSGQICNVIFSGTQSPQFVSSTGTPTTIRFRNIEVNKGTDTTKTLDFSANPTLLGTLTLTNGTLITRAGTIPLSNTTLPLSTKLIVAGTSSVVSPAGMNLRIQGEIQVLESGSNFFFQSVGMPTRSDRLLSVEGNGSLKIYNGSMTIWGGLNLTDNSNSLLNNGSLIIDPRAVTTPLTRAQSMFAIGNNAVFNGTGGQIIFPHFNQNTTGPAKTIDFLITSSAGATFSGTDILIGSGASTSTTAQGFELKSSAPIHNLIINTGASPIGDCILNDPSGFLEIMDSLQIISGRFTSTANSSIILHNPVIGAGTINLNPLTNVIIKGNALSVPFRFSPNNPNQIIRLVIQDQAGTVQLAENLIVTDSLFLTNGNINLNGKRLQIQNYGYINNNQIAGTGTLEVTGKLSITNRAGYLGAGNGFAVDRNSITSIVLGAASTIEYAAADTQFITGGQYQNLESTNGGRRIFSTSDTLKIAAYFNPGTSLYSVNGSKVQYNGSVQQFLPNQFTFDTLIISSTYIPSNQAVQIPSGNGNEVRVRGVIRPMTGHLVTNGNLRLVSDATADGMIAKPNSPSSAVRGIITQERFAAASPVAIRNIGLALSGSTTSQLKNNYTPFVLSYDETASGDRNQGYTWLDTGITIQPGRGYYMYFPQNADYTIESKGEVVSGTVNFPAITWTVDPQFRAASGWCIAANPYPSTIDWMAPVGWTRNRISTTIFYLDPVTGQQASFNNGIGTNGATRYIQPGQGFWVKATGLAPTIMATEDVKVIVRNKFFKAAQNHELELIKVGFVTPDHQDEIILHLEKGFSPGFEPNDDTEAFPMELAPVPASIALVENFKDRLSINRLDADSIWGHTFPLSIYQKTSGTSHITLNEIPANFKGQIILTDILENKIHSLESSSSYAFEVSNQDTGWIENRFYLRFVQDGHTLETTNLTDVVLYPNPASSQTTIQWNSEFNPEQIQVISSVGQTMETFTLSPGQSIQTISLATYSPGIYWVKISGKDQSKTEKLIIR